MNIISKEEVCEVIGQYLKEGYDYDECVNNLPESLEEESQQYVDEFFNSCEDGIDKYEAFVKAFF